MSNDREYRVNFTDENGRFRDSASEKIYLWEARKKGYLPKRYGFPPIIQGEYNECIVNLIPRDGTLKVNFDNSFGLHDTLYVAIYSPLQDSEMPISRGIIVGYPFFAHGMFPKSIHLDLASEETIDIYWGPQPIPSFQTKLAPYHSSIFVLRGDTTEYTITY
jgi:hypothetical protein